MATTAVGVGFTRAELPYRYRIALAKAIKVVHDAFVDDLVAVASGVPVAETSMADELPKAWLDDYDEDFARRFLVCLVTASTKLTLPRQLRRPSCRLEQFALEALLTEAADQLYPDNDRRFGQTLEDLRGVLCRGDQSYQHAYELQPGRKPFDRDWFLNPLVQLFTETENEDGGLPVHPYADLYSPNGRPRFILFFADFWAKDLDLIDQVMRERDPDLRGRAAVSFEKAFHHLVVLPGISQLKEVAGISDVWAETRILKRRTGELQTRIEFELIDEQPLLDRGIELSEESRRIKRPQHVAGAAYTVVIETAGWLPEIGFEPLDVLY